MSLENEHDDSAHGEPIYRRFRGDCVVQTQRLGRGHCYHRVPFHSLSRIHFVCTSSVVLQLPVSFLPPKVLSTKYPHGEAGWLFTTLHHSQKTMNLTSTAGHHRDRITAPLTEFASFLFTLSYPFLFYPSLTASPDQGGLSTGVGPSFSCCAFDLQVSLSLPFYCLL